MLHTHRNSSLENNFSKLKSKISKAKKSYVFYEIPCNNCELCMSQKSQYFKDLSWYAKNTTFNEYERPDGKHKLLDWDWLSLNIRLSFIYDSSYIMYVLKLG